MSKKEERMMVFEMLSEGKIDVEEAETLLGALADSHQPKRPMGFSGMADILEFDLPNFDLELGKGLEGLKDLGSVFEDFDFDLDWHEDQNDA